MRHYPLDDIRLRLRAERGGCGAPMLPAARIGAVPRNERRARHRHRAGMGNPARA